MTESNLKSYQVSHKIPGFQKELMEYLGEMQKFHLKDTGEGHNSYYENVLLKLSAYSARSSFIRMLVISSNEEQAKRFRLDIVDPFIKECERQFKIWSRLITYKGLEQDMEY